MRVTFGICTDLHCSYIHDSLSRLQAFFHACKAEGVDFTIDLGDFCLPDEKAGNERDQLLSLLSQWDSSFYHVLGNHDMDPNSKQNVMDSLKMTSPYYSFDQGNVHFIVLDASYYQVDNTYISYDYGNYTRAPKESLLPVLPPFELEWLKQDLASTNYPSIIFSHQSLIESRTGIQNAEAFRSVIRTAPAGVRMAICGHEHVDRLEQKEGVYYLCLNSISYYWAGANFDHTTYGDVHEKDHPHLRHVFPYKEPLYAIIQIHDDEICIKGTASSIVGASPKSLQFHKPGLVDEVTASICDKTLLL